jgi:hypothetical protein
MSQLHNRYHYACDVAAPSSFFPKCLIFSGLKQAYLRTPTTPAGLGIAFEKAVKRNPQGMLYYLKIKVTAIKI